MKWYTSLLPTIRKQMLKDNIRLRLTREYNTRPLKILISKERFIKPRIRYRLSKVRYGRNEPWVYK